jgi:uncharacterized protein
MAKEKYAPGITVKPSAIDGLGCFATKFFPKGRKIAEYEGERISRAETARRLKGKRRIHICAVDIYWAIDGSVGGNGTQYINHSCDPNCYIKIIYGHILFFARRDIQPGEELTVDYVLSYHDDRTGCSCGAASCRGTINLVKKGLGAR